MTLSFCVPAFANDSFVAEPAVPYYFEESTAYGRNALSIEWGGNEALVADSYSCSGRYYNDIRIVPMLIVTADIHGNLTKRTAQTEMQNTFGEPVFWALPPVHCKIGKPVLL